MLRGPVMRCWRGARFVRCKKVVRAAECKESGVVVMLCLQQLCVELCLPEALGDRRFWREESTRSFMQGKAEPHHVTACSHAFHAPHVKDTNFHAHGCRTLLASTLTGLETILTLPTKPGLSVTVMYDQPHNGRRTSLTKLYVATT